MKKCPDCEKQLNYVGMTLFGLGTGGMYHCDYCNNDYIEDISAWYKKNDKGEYEFLKVTDFKNFSGSIGDPSVTQNLMALQPFSETNNLDPQENYNNEVLNYNRKIKLERIHQYVDTILSEELPHTHTAHDFGKLDGKKEVAKKVKEILDERD